jgi:MFS family permease
LLLSSDIVRFVVMTATGVLLLVHAFNFGILLVFSFLFGLFDAVFMPAITALTPEIVPEELLPQVNSARSLSNSLFGAMAGPALGGVLAAWNLPLAFFFDAATFVVSASCLLLMRATPNPSDERAQQHPWHELKEGVRYVLATPWLIWTLVTAGLTNAFIFMPFGTLMPYFIRHDLHRGKAAVALAMTVSGLGWFVGSYVVGTVAIPRRRLMACIVSWSLSSAVMALTGLVHQVWGVYAIGFAMGPLLSVGNIWWESLMQSEVPREMLGRASSVDWFISLGLGPVGLSFAGILVTRVGVRPYFTVASLLYLPVAALFLVSRAVHEVDAHRVVDDSETSKSDG